MGVNDRHASPQRPEAVCPRRTVLPRLLSVFDRQRIPPSPPAGCHAAHTTGVGGPEGERVHLRVPLMTQWEPTPHCRRRPAGDRPKGTVARPPRRPPRPCATGGVRTRSRSVAREERAITEAVRRVPERVRRVATHLRTVRWSPRSPRSAVVASRPRCAGEAHRVVAATGLWRSRLPAQANPLRGGRAGGGCVRVSHCEQLAPGKLSQASPSEGPWGTPLPMGDRTTTRALPGATTPHTPCVGGGSKWAKGGREGWRRPCAPRPHLPPAIPLPIVEQTVPMWTMTGKQCW